jgi:hypothetical protein
MKSCLLLRLQNQPFALESLLRGLPAEQILSRPLPDKWSIFENLAHLARYHEILTERVGLIIAGGNPLFKPYRADDDPGFFEWQKKPYPQLMRDFYADRSKLNSTLDALTMEQLRCTARHPTYSTMNVEGCVEFFLLHEAHHFFTIFKLTAKLRPDRVMGL